MNRTAVIAGVCAGIGVLVALIFTRHLGVGAVIALGVLSIAYVVGDAVSSRHAK